MEADFDSYLALASRIPEFSWLDTTVPQALVRIFARTFFRPLTCLKGKEKDSGGVRMVCMLGCYPGGVGSIPTTATLFFYPFFFYEDEQIKMKQTQSPRSSAVGEFSPAEEQLAVRILEKIFAETRRSRVQIPSRAQFSFSMRGEQT